eukprot:TRINITY_DN17455_c0_g1_i1.p1 TRINITY_DN17455_c0_g1~~TRINITY_DN17455_c0_g1_i1.p1  ORF type:complete len:368 (-),score=52.71 TRINITY_DN17455_c0_g1_i1:207-1157(-)
MAIFFDAARLLFSKEAEAIALGIQHDRDFLYLISRLHSSGHRVVVLLPAGSPLSRCRTYRSKGAEIVMHGSPRPQPKWKALLYPNGTGSWMKMEASDVCRMTESQEKNISAVTETLSKLGYVQEAKVEDSYAPQAALVKFLFSNRVDAFAVYPAPLLFQEVFRTIENTRDLKSNPENLAFVMPYSEFSPRSKKEKEKYGSRTCGERVRAGAPFMMVDSESLVRKVFKKLGFLKTRSETRSANSSLAATITRFCTLKMNKRHLRLNGYDVLSCSNTDEMVSMLRQAFLSVPHSSWQVHGQSTSAHTTRAGTNRFSRN